MIDPRLPRLKTSPLNHMSSTRGCSSVVIAHLVQGAVKVPAHHGALDAITLFIV